MSQATMPDVSGTTQEKKGERQANGRFAGGNKGGPGNPFGRRMAAMREAIQRAIGVEDIEAIMRMLREKSLDGDLAATRLLLQYAVGKPKPVVEPDRVEVEAWEVAEESWVEAGRCTAALQGVPVGVANAMMEAMSESKTNQLGEAIVNPAAAAELAKAAARDNDEEDDRPLTAEEIAEAKREWVEAKALYAEMVAAQEAADAVSRPSVAESNGVGVAYVSRSEETDRTERPSSETSVDETVGGHRTQNVNPALDGDPSCGTSSSPAPPSSRAA